MFKALKGARHNRPFAPWRIVVWLVMLLAAVGFVINTYGAILAANAIGAMSAEAIAAGGPDPRIVLAWWPDVDPAARRIVDLGPRGRPRHRRRADADAPGGHRTAHPDRTACRLQRQHQRLAPGGDVLAQVTEPSLFTE